MGKLSSSATTFNLSAYLKPMLASILDQHASFQVGVTCLSQDHFHQLYKKLLFESSITPPVNPLCGIPQRFTTPKFARVTWMVVETLVRVTREDLSFADPLTMDHGFFTELFHGDTDVRGKRSPVFTLRFLSLWTGSKRKSRRLVTEKQLMYFLKKSFLVLLAVTTNPVNVIVQRFLGRLRKVLMYRLYHQLKLLPP